jgi:hypothetical protein
MARRRLQEAWEAIPAEVKIVLNRNGQGVSTPRIVAGMAVDCDDAADWAIQMVDQVPGGACGDLALRLWRYVEAAQDAVSKRPRVRRAEDLIEGVGRVEMQDRERRRLRETQYQADRVAVAAAAGRTRRQQDQAGKAEGDTLTADARAQAEQREKLRWTKLVVDLMVEAGLPRVAAAGQTMNPEGALLMCTGASRARTIRARARRWKRVRDWLMAAYRIPWPETAAQFIDYLGELRAQPCKRTEPRSALSALAYMEARGDVPLERRLSCSEFVLSVVNAMTLELSMTTAPPQKAPSVFMIQVVAMELYVVDEEHPLLLRAYCWVKLVKIWAGLRGDDTRGILPSELRLHPSGLEGMLDRTKTSGPGRRVRWLPFFVARQAYLAVGDWLSIGFALWGGKLLSFQRDYLVPIPTADYASVRRAPASYEDMARWSRAVLRELRKPRWEKDVGWKETSLPLYPPEVALYWTEHSERNVLNSWAAVLGHSKDDRDYIGRWVPEQSDDYMRTARAKVFAVQSQVSAAIRGAPDRVDESRELERFREYLGKRLEEGAAEQVYADINILDEQYGLRRDNTPTEVAEASETEEGEKERELIAVVEDEPLEETRARFVVCFGRKKGHARVHTIPGCWRRPGVDILHFEYTDDLGGYEELTYCRDCHRAAPWAIEEDSSPRGEQSPEETSSSSSTPDCTEEPA